MNTYHPTLPFISSLCQPTTPQYLHLKYFTRFPLAYVIVPVIFTLPCTCASAVGHFSPMIMPSPTPWVRFLQCAYFQHSNASRSEDMRESMSVYLHVGCEKTYLYILLFSSLFPLFFPFFSPSSPFFLSILSLFHSLPSPPPSLPSFPPPFAPLSLAFSPLSLPFYPPFPFFCPPHPLFGCVSHTF